jgi:hypothetical protein
LVEHVLFNHLNLDAAARLMAPAIDDLHTMGGGNREQKDIFRDVFMPRGPLSWWAPGECSRWPAA